MIRSCDQVKVTVKAGPHARTQCPVTARVDAKALFGPVEAKPEHVCLCADGGAGEPIPCQASQTADGVVEVSWIQDQLPAGGEATYGIGTCDEAVGKPMEVVHTQDSNVEITAADGPVTTYHYGPDVARPHLLPVIGPGGVSVTRTEPTDHVHHRSIWIAQGDANGVDNWSEEEGHGRTVVQKLDIAQPGPVFSELLAQSNWESSAGEKIMEETTRIRIYNLPASCRCIDFDIKWAATEGDITFGDTKEAGTLSVRVAVPMEVREGGKIENSYGGINEAETWGKRAHWCDYSGMVQGHHVGIAVFDYPTNFRYPTYWHVRDYGLMTANQWGIAAFTGDPARNGSYTLPEGHTLHFRFRVYVHEGDAKAGDVAGKYHDFINPPQVELEC